jgi:thioredoxin 1
MAVFNINDAEFTNELASHPRVIVKYYADWCGSCKLFSPKFKRISEEETFSHIHFIEVNAEENQMARKAAGVDNLPFFAIFKNGELLEGTVTIKEEVVITLLEKL